MTAKASISGKTNSTLSSGQLRLDEMHDGVRVSVAGDWTLLHYAVLHKLVKKAALDKDSVVQFDLQELGGLDTSGAALLAGLLGSERLLALTEEAPGLSTERRDLLQTVGRALQQSPYQERRHRYEFGDVLVHTGRSIEAFWRHFFTLLDFMGRTLVTLLFVLPRPWRWRVTSLVNQIEQTGFNAVPIIALLTFLVGAVVALLGATVLADYGLTIYTVDLVAYSFLREFGVLLTAVMLAGRTASAYTAQIGSMKANEELDALRVQGLDPIELLVLPRALAMMLLLPLLTFVAVIAGLAGGGMVAYLSLDIPVARYLSIVNEVPFRHFLVGLSKAPLFAFIIALVGCLEGFKAGASAESVGLHTTSSVVQSIFMVILLDALVALFYTEIGW